MSLNDELIIILELESKAVLGDEAINPFNWKRRPSPDQVPHELDEETEMLLTLEINALAASLTPSQESYQLRSLFIEKLQRILDLEWPGKEIKAHVFGSTVNGLGTRTSDVDVCLTTPWDDRINGISNMHILATGLRKHGMVSIYTVAAAKVPICKFYDPEFHVNCDINVNNAIALRNTKLIKTYVDLDPRVRPLMLVVKYWTRQRVLNDAAKGGTLSSYCWAMMVLNFLQIREPPILPCLHEMYFAKLKADATKVNPVIVNGVDCSFHEDVGSLKGFGEKNAETLGTLLHAFFRRYAFEFEYDTYVISVRHGRYVPKVDKGWDVDIERNRRFLCVEEPFNPQRNLGNSADAFSVAGLRKEFERALPILESGGTFARVCEPYIPPSHRVISSQPPMLANGNGTYLPETNGKLRGGDVYTNWHEAYRLQLQQTYHHKSNGSVGGSFFPRNNNPTPYKLNGASNDRRSGYTNGQNNDRHWLAGLNLMRNPVPYSSDDRPPRDDFHRIQSLSLESRQLDNHNKRGNYSSLISDRRLMDSEKSKRNGPSSWSTTPPLRRQNGTHAGQPPGKSPVEPEKEKNNKIVETDSDEADGDAPARSPITVIIEKQSEDKNTVETTVAEIRSGGRRRTLSCSRSEIHSERSNRGGLSPDRRRMSPSPSDGDAGKRHRRRTSTPMAQNTTDSSFEARPASVEAKPISTPPRRRTNSRTDNIQTDRTDSHKRVAKSIDSGSRSPDRLNNSIHSQKGTTVSDSVEVNAPAPAPPSKPPQSNGIMPERERYAKRAMHSEAAASPTGESSANGKNDTGDSAPGAKRRGSKGTLLWANHSHRNDGRSAPSNPRRQSQGGGNSEPSTPRAEDDSAIADSRRGRAASSGGKWARPRSLSASDTPRMNWPGVRSAPSPERIQIRDSYNQVAARARDKDASWKEIPTTPSTVSTPLNGYHQSHMQHDSSAFHGTKGLQRIPRSDSIEHFPNEKKVNGVATPPSLVGTSIALAATHTSKDNELVKRHVASDTPPSSHCKGPNGVYSKAGIIGDAAEQPSAGRQKGNGIHHGAHHQTGSHRHALSQQQQQQPSRKSDA
ncbi:uncharacterized protein EV422DRAFT_565042 [Fimicolochytrium jonesii]|uniref:uncharacterized protein n=1 Tax=Fimicolochytrium jonesii TaxID=1396493 RepID=UPI0022FDCFCD|nr:uncharacterized protein EV422DRAFT_565042 [Fimicolochytrium jonesii]KAI8824346.1 hypothetical protein EV422DRAFT_565042 [Fimicolochytrium jonesii]